MNNEAIRTFIVKKIALGLGISVFLFILSSSFTSLNNFNKKLFEKQILFHAWNEDQQNSFEFTALNDSKFRYKISLKDSLQKKFLYSGYIIKKLTRDTIFLKFSNAENPLLINNYLIIEVSGKYLIQTFRNNNKRVFLRRQNIGSRGSSF